MYIILLLLSIFVFIRTISYGIYELKQENNKIGAYTIFILAVIGLISSNIVFWLQ